MTSITSSPAQASTWVDRSRWAASDGWALTKRSLLHYVRVPQLVFFAAVQPIMFVLLFRYVFGGAIEVPGFDYVNYMMPGIFAQTVVFGATATAVGLADDMQKGAIDRFRSLPTARSAVLVGRTTADLVRLGFSVGLMTIVGFLVGFRIETSIVGFLAGVGLLMLFAYSLEWGFALMGLNASNAEAAQLMAFPILMPLTFASSAFVPVESMPDWLQVFTRNQPVSVVIDASRALMLGGPTSELVTKSLLWSIGLVLLFVPLAVRQYRRRT